jgi:hypothetical protein
MKIRSIALSVLFLFAGAAQADCSLRGVEFLSVYGLAGKQMQSIRDEVAAKGYDLVKDDEDSRFLLIVYALQGGPGYEGNKSRNFPMELYDGGRMIRHVDGYHRSAIVFDYTKLITKAAIAGIRKLPTCSEAL